jgi:hypothetical protein
MANTKINEQLQLAKNKKFVSKKDKLHPDEKKIG